MSDKKDALSMATIKDALAGAGSAIPGLSVEDREKMVTSIHEKLGKIVGQPVGQLDMLPSKVRHRVEALRELQQVHSDLEQQFLKERAELEQKYQRLYSPLYAKRADIVSGVAEPPSAMEAETKEGEPDVKGVPDFWLQAMKNNEVLAEQITEKDELALKYIKDISSINLPEGKGFKLDFTFSENPYFKNSMLSKTYYMIEDDEPILEKADGTEIQWQPGKNLTQKVLKKKPKKGTKTAQPITKTEPCDSFFNFFSPPQVPAEEDEIDEEEAEELQEAMEQDYEVGSTLKDKIIPHAVKWFTGEAAEEEGFADDGADDDEDDDDEGDFEEDEEEDEADEDEAPPAKGHRGAAGKRTAPAKSAAKEGEQPAECKQQ